VLIDLIRRPRKLPDFLKDVESGRVYFSSIAIAELYAGTRSRDDADLVSRIVQVASRIHRVLTPTAGDWAMAGRVIARRIRLSGEIEPRDHLADVLIVASTARLKGTVVSANIRHIEAWVTLAQGAGLDVTLAD
jgi:predicted nucleic acid-binding protein